jgi:hypothetical protein
MQQNQSERYRTFDLFLLNWSMIADIKIFSIHAQLKQSKITKKSISRNGTSENDNLSVTNATIICNLQVIDS